MQPMLIMFQAEFLETVSMILDYETVSMLPVVTDWPPNFLVRYYLDFFRICFPFEVLGCFFEPQPSEGDQITIRKIRNYVVDYPHEVIVLTFFSKAFWSKWDYEHRLHFQPPNYSGPFGYPVIF